MRWERRDENGVGRRTYGPVVRGVYDSRHARRADEWYIVLIGKVLVSTEEHLSRFERPDRRGETDTMQRRRKSDVLGGTECRQVVRVKVVFVVLEELEALVAELLR